MSEGDFGAGWVRESLNRLADMAGPAPDAPTRHARWGRTPVRPGSRLREDELLVTVSDGRSLAVQRLRRPQAALRPDALGARLELFEAILEELFTDALGATDAAALSEPEERLLREAGFDPGPLGPHETAPALDQARREYARLLADSLTVEEAAARLGVNGSRIRQRLGGERRSLYGVKLGREWRLPRFQFADRDVVPGLPAVLRRLPRGLHPVAVQRWLSTPTPDLSDDETGPQGLSPLDWLQTGRAPHAVAELAAHL